MLRTLTEAGYEAYFVGGCVRDRLLGVPVKDMDIATSALPAQVMSLFVRTVPTGLQHGTVTVILEGHTFEVTTFRTESGYVDYRRPQTVEYVTSLEEDLRRRDFTMNAMAMDAEGNVCDPFGGREDLARGVLRCVGEAEQRFGEDALRMLRCIRFAAAYGLEVEAGTWAALREQAPLLRHIAMERCRAELERMVEGPAPVRALRLLADSGLWRHFKVRPVSIGAAGARLPARRRRWSRAGRRCGSPSCAGLCCGRCLAWTSPPRSARCGALVFAKRRMGGCRSRARLRRLARAASSRRRRRGAASSGGSGGTNTVIVHSGGGGGIGWDDLLLY
ncbi:CCA tRNA nucleotidyltransferase, partial [Gordoniibacillus kamchatkensis]|uniref:CCA tRNA nucleotidyltransferase n=1 Tax=Gordoniibacillus kamchatkensis TaxID=1590651 RepID=UPI00373AF544